MASPSPANWLAKGPVGRVLTVRRPLIYRALDRLVALGLATPVHSEPGDGGPQRLVHKATPAGKTSTEEMARGAGSACP